MKLKPCPFRVHGEKTYSLTVAGEYFYNETFMPCMGEDCPAFKKSDIICTNYGANYDMILRAKMDEVQPVKYLSNTYQDPSNTYQEEEE